MCQDTEESGLPPIEGQQQDPDIEPDEGQNKEVVQLARDLEDVGLRDWHRT